MTHFLVPPSNIEERGRPTDFSVAPTTWVAALKVKTLWDFVARIGQNIAVGLGGFSAKDFDSPLRNPDKWRTASLAVSKGQPAAAGSITRRRPVESGRTR